MRRGRGGAEEEEGKIEGKRRRGTAGGEEEDGKIGEE